MKHIESYDDFDVYLDYVTDQLIIRDIKIKYNISWKRVTTILKQFNPNYEKELLSFKIKHGIKCTSCSKRIYLNDLYKHKNRSKELGGVKKICKLCDRLLYGDQRKINISGIYKDPIRSISHKKTIHRCMKQRYKLDSVFRIEMIIRGRIRSAIKRSTKKGHALDLLGCSIDQLKTHLQQTAINNDYTTFDINNYSGKEYHIDHIVPCDAFNLKCLYHQKLCFHYTNLQILLKEDNLAKGYKYG